MIFPRSPAVSWLVPHGKEGSDDVAAPGWDRQGTGCKHSLLRNTTWAQEREASRVGLGLRVRN